ncbi:hypothetical protein E4U43_003454 [Claviceps pusilla]|uniref:PLC-like phosphodiesterase n=1 Tax=Claviceps pusilla TaxID=123648 RepID=A0A9P7SXJ6_9HYPO|nr:hypothetical protein E4U43_003454 [Claviceps pusilla]
MPSFPKLVLAALVTAAAAGAHPQAQMASGSTTAGSTSTDQPCNNSPLLCGRAYSAVTHMGAHNSAFMRDDSTSNSLSGNQFQNATLALDAGLRLLQVQVHKLNSTLELCHSSCALLDAGPLEAWLSAIHGWMVANPRDVVTLLLVNSDGAPASDFAPVFERSGLAAMAYDPASDSRSFPWPTLQDMITANTRLVTFITNIHASPAAPYLMPEFSHVFETRYQISDLAGFNNCTVARPSRAAPADQGLASGYLSLVNHFKYQRVFAGFRIPDVDSIDLVNSPDTTALGNLGTHLQQCKTEWKRVPNFVLVDFWNRGNVTAALDAMNGVTDAVGRRTVVLEQQQQQQQQQQQDHESGVSRPRLDAYGALVAFSAFVVLL